mmetsp:Transcript_15079/g.22730  ORF Transcript_15079/g.22730 Transcript_15079/m.22730 type:complete len:490 (-) Transcript_15079:101-1570(-)
MFRESANFEKAEAEANNANMQPLAIKNSRNLHSLFDDNPNTSHGNSTTDHYHRPAAGAGGGRPSTTKDQANAATDENTTLGGQTDNQTLSFTLIFLSLMVVYIGFCCHYRKVKVRRSYDDSAHSQNANSNNNSRQRRQRDNQAVLDESSSAANRAAADSEEQRKLEERKVRIGEVLWTRLIVDDEEVEGGDGGAKSVAGHHLNVNGGGDEENQGVNANDDESHEKSDLVDEEMGNEDAAATVEGKTLAQDEDATATAASLATKQEDEEAPSIEETTISTVPSSSEETITTIPSNEVVPTIGTSPSSTLAHSTPPSSPFRKYADALSCNNCHHHATNYCNNHHINYCNTTTTQNNDATTSSSPAGNNSSLTTITLSDIQQTYGDECNICLSTFQVGDRAAWSKHHFNGCVHVFHDECMKRWLLVRDGCPICRRLYLGEGTTTKGLVPTPQDDGGGANGVDNDDGGGESGRDLESGDGGMGNAAIITVEEE